MPIKKDEFFSSQFQATVTVSIFYIMVIMDLTYINYSNNGNNRDSIWWFSSLCIFIHFLIDFIIFTLFIKLILTSGPCINTISIIHIYYICYLYILFMHNNKKKLINLNYIVYYCYHAYFVSLIVWFIDNFLYTCFSIIYRVFQQSWSSNPTEKNR